MKQTALLFIALLLFQCTKDDPAGPASTMTASIDGQSWQMDGTSLTQVFLDGNQLFIQGHGSDGKWLGIYVANAVVGAHTATGRSTGQIATCYVRYALPGDSYSFTSFTPVTNAGQVTITEIDHTNKTVSGSFSGSLSRVDTGTGLVEVTSGIFTKMKYEEGNLLVLIEEVPQNLAFAQVDGSARMFTFAGTGGTASSIGWIYFIDGAAELELHIPANMVVGDYTLGPIGSSDYAMRLAGEESVSGMVSITRVGDGRIEATFSFTSSSFTVTNGVLGSTF